MSDKSGEIGWQVNNPANGCTLNFDKAWKDIFADPEWMFKTGLGGVFNATCLVLFGANPLFFPIVFAIISLLCGYLLRSIREKVANPESPLPKWSNWPELFVSGLTWLVIELILAISLVAAAALAAVTPGMISIGTSTRSAAATCSMRWASPTTWPWAV